jgi:hypothetical protein
MTENEIELILAKKKICRIAFFDGKYPYIAPFQYVYENGTLYFHFTDYGKKKKILNKNKNVCVSIEDLEPDLSNFCFITIQAELKEVTNQEEKDRIVEKMASEGKNNFSANFLSAHGLEKQKGWDLLKKQKKINILKLMNIKKRIGLKSI